MSISEFKCQIFAKYPLLTHSPPLRCISFNHFYFFPSLDFEYSRFRSEKLNFSSTKYYMILSAFSTYFPTRLTGNVINWSIFFSRFSDFICRFTSIFSVRKILRGEFFKFFATSRGYKIDLQSLNRQSIKKYKIIGEKL